MTARAAAEQLSERSAAVFYDPVDHSYRLDGQRVPSVTQILIQTGRIETKWFRDGAADRGRRVHAACMVLDELGTLRWQDLDPEIGAEVEAYAAFKRDCRPMYDGIERAFWHRTLQYGGRPDRSCQTLFSGRATLELKTGQEADWHGLQLAGYERLRPRGARYAVYLKKTGRYQVRHYKKADDHREFIRALRDVWALWRQWAAEAAKGAGDGGN